MPRLQAYDNGLDCFADTYTLLLLNLGIDARILGDDWGYRYIEPEAHQIEPFLRLRIHRHGYEDAIARWYGIVERRVNHPNPAALWDYVRRVLDDGRQVAIQIDTFDYPHSLFHQRLHHLHRVVVAGHQGDDVYILDELPGHSFRGWMATVDLDRGIASDVLADRFTTVGGSHCTVDLPRPVALTDVSTADLRETLLANVETYLAARGRAEVPTGWRAAARFIEDIRRYADTAPTIGDRLIVHGVSFFGSLAKQRRQNAYFVELVGDRFGVDLAGVADSFRQFSQRLDKLRAVFFFGASARRPPSDHLGRLTDRLAEMFAEERHRMATLNRLVGPTDG